MGAGESKEILDKRRNAWLYDEFKSLKEITPEELAQHNKPDDLWIAVKGVVLDCTKFKDKHPGGSAILEKVAGQDGTKRYVYIDQHFEKGYWQEMKKLVIGRLKGAEKPPEPPAK
eukprot:g63591.t1